MPRFMGDFAIHKDPARRYAITPCEDSDLNRITSTIRE